MNNHRIIHGDALGVLRTLESESVQMCVTSPPYYGLRSYKTVPQIWGNHNGCDHVFGDTRRKPVKLQAGNPEFQRPWREASSDVEATSGNFCLKCQSWRGELGLEPTFQLFIAHLIEIFAEVKRVLKSDGICVVNLGDSYSTTPSGICDDPMKTSGLSGQRKGTQVVARLVKTTRPKDKTVRNKSLMNIPGRFAIAMTDELQFIQRNECIWYKRGVEY
jgi:site-specific DNA-methyltransferase (adenine-specific)